jgi:peptide/nickel transport system permease protein
MSLVGLGLHLRRRLARAWGRSRANRLGILGVAILIFFVLLAVLAPLVAPHDPSVQTGRPFASPSASHLLGTNDVGQDILSELIFGSRISLTIGVLAALVAIVVGGVVGIASGFFRGLADTLLMRFVDVTLALPFLPLLIVLAVFLGRSLVTMVFVISVVIWARPARVLRSQVLSVRERGDVQASRAMGARPRHTLLHHVLPAVGPLIIAQFVRAANIAILLEASLSFLGLGDPTNKSWGTVLYYANSRGAFLTGAWLWWVLPTGLLISMVVLAFAFIGYALEERTDPRLSAGRPPMLAQTASLETARLDSLAAPARAEGAS